MKGQKLRAKDVGLVPAGKAAKRTRTSEDGRLTYSSPTLSVLTPLAHSEQGVANTQPPSCQLCL